MKKILDTLLALSAYGAGFFGGAMVILFVAKMFAPIGFLDMSKETADVLYNIVLNIFAWDAVLLWILCTVQGKKEEESGQS